MLHQLLLLHSAFAEIGTMADKIRLDRLVELQGFAESRERAKAVIMSGAIYINGNRADKPGLRSLHRRFYRCPAAKRRAESVFD